jgi:mono/diheme cytochrome c family protein
MIEFNRTSALYVLGLLVVNPAFAAAQPGPRDLATEVKAVFQAKCSECHGPQVPKPKGNFGYVLDLKKLAAESRRRARRRTR